ncbi:MAG: type 4a pilus biogenesis protein PilO [Candidatus Omnitrophota bacterium]
MTNNLLAQFKKKIEGLDNKKLLVVFIALLVFIYLDYSFVMKLQLRNLRNTAPKIEKVKSDLNNLSLQLSKMQQAKEEHLAKQREFLSQAKKVISEGQVPSLLEEIANTAKNNNAELIQMKPLRQNLPAAKAKTPQGQNFSPLLITVELSCGYHELGHFINDLENNPIFIAVEDFAVIPQQKDYFKQKVGLTLKTYVEE